jgi:hypothetical protein
VVSRALTREMVRAALPAAASSSTAASTPTSRALSGQVVSPRSRLASCAVKLYEGTPVMSGALPVLSTVSSPIGPVVFPPSPSPAVRGSFVGGRSGEPEDSWASDMVVARATPMDEDVRDDGSDIFSEVPAVIRDFEIVLPAAPSVAEEEGDGEDWCRYCLGACWAEDF